MLILGLCMLIIGILLFIYSVNSLNNTKKINDSVIEQNKQIENENNILRQNHSSLLFDMEVINKDIAQKKEQLEDIQSNITASAKAKEELSQKAFENYCNILERQYKEAEEEQQQLIGSLQTAYSDLQLQLMQEADQAKADLDKIQATRAAALQAQLKEKEIKEQLAFYCLTISQTNLDDIGVLERIKPKLHNPRILSMLIWQTYYQKPMTALCNNVLGSSTVCGIYKITNQINDMCYIGQAVDIATRWKSHAKCGLQIDAPVGNKLYKAMQEFGLHNFSFELLEACPREQLNEKERYYISLYQSNQYGYNILSGNK